MNDQQPSFAVNLRLEAWVWDSNDPSHTGLQGHLCIIENNRVEFAAEYRGLTIAEAANFAAAAVVLATVEPEAITSNDWDYVLQKATLNGRLISQGQNITS